MSLLRDDLSTAYDEPRNRLLDDAALDPWAAENVPRGFRVSTMPADATPAAPCLDCGHPTAHEPGCGERS